MPSPEVSSEPASPRRTGRGAGRTILGFLLMLAVLGAAALVTTDDARWLRLGIVAALWAALAGAFAAARYRREGAIDHEYGDELRRIYELELEREVAARREYELRVEAETRRRLEHEIRNEVRGELDGLRSELRTLRQNLEALLGGEVLVERVALRAESTRLRSLSDQSRAASSADRALPPGASRNGPQRQPNVHSTQVVEPRQQPARSEPAARANASGSQPIRTEQPRQQPPTAHRHQPMWPGRSEPPSAEPPRPEPRRAEPAPPDARRVEPADPTNILPRYQGSSAASPADRPETSQSLDFRPLRRPEPAMAEPPPAGPAYAATAAWDRMDSWPGPQAQPSAAPAQPGHGNGSGSHRHRQEEEPSHGGRRRRPEEDTGSHAGRSVDDLIASYGDETPTRRRHRRDGG